MVDFLGSQLFHVTFYEYEVDSIITTDTSNYKLRSLALSESESLGRVYPFTFGGILSPDLIVVPLMLMIATPAGGRVRTLGLSGDPA